MDDTIWIAGGLVIGFLVLFGLAAIAWGWRLKNANKELRNLTSAEILDFRSGNSTLDPNNPHASIYGLPYDRSKEISRHDIELGRTELQRSFNSV